MPLFWLTGGLTVASGLVYIRRGLKFVSEDTAEKEKK
jgi:hypothetical protein